MLSRMLEERSVKRFRELLKNSSRIVITCHVRPDGDAMGSSLGLSLLLASLGKDSKVVTPDTPPRQLAFMPGMKDVIPFTRYEEYATRLVKEADLIVCCDFNSFDRQEKLGEIMESAKAAKVMVDHHLYPQDFADVKFSFPQISSASELMFRIITDMGYYPEISLDCATALATGIITDTKNLTVNCANPEIYIIMMELTRKGVDVADIVKRALHTKRYEGIRLHAYALSNNYRIYKKHSAALVWLSLPELEKFDYEKGDTEGLVDAAGEAVGVLYTIFLREDKDCIKVSTRSTDDIPVNKLCEKYFQGGGHLRAAGGKYFGSIDECIRVCEEAMDFMDNYLPDSNNTDKA